MKIPKITVTDSVIQKCEQKHDVQIEDAVQGVRNAKKWRKVGGRYVCDSRTDSGRRIFVVVVRSTVEWQIVTAWWP